MKILLIAFFIVSQAAAAAPNYDAAEKSFRKTLGQLVAADTTNPPGNEARAVKIIAARLKAEKIPYEITAFGPNRQNITARLKGDGSRGKPLLLLAHLDVVGVANQQWSVPQHRLTEKDGYLYGRGVLDDLGMAVVNLEVFLAIKKSGKPLKRDLILALTGDEESGGAGIEYVLKNKPESVNAGLALNEGGDIALGADGKVRYVAFIPAEKTYQDFIVTAKGPSGHSSRPIPGNAIYKLAHALARFSEYAPKERLIPVTRAYFAERAKLETGDLAKAMKEIADSKGDLPKKALKIIEKDPSLASQLYTTCIATMVSGGTRVNALPTLATANINCRILPNEKVSDVENKIRSLINDPEIEVRRDTEMEASEASPVTGEGPTAIRKVVGEMWPGLPVIPGMASGATDSRSLRLHGVAAYGIDPFPILESEARMHGVDERIPVASVRTGLEFVYRLTSETVFGSP